MQIFAEAFWLPKVGSTSSEYEDAYCPQEIIRGEATTSMRFGVADGATEASYSKLWAQLLVRAYCQGQLDALPDVIGLAPLQEQWSNGVLKPDMPWYLEEKVKSGAYAALVGLELLHHTDSRDEAGEWNALAVGDCCLAQVRGEEVLARFPIESSAGFNSRPHLISSNSTANLDIDAHTLRVSGSFVSGDNFYLMSDALACWFMKEAEEGTAPWRDLRDIGTSGFHSFEDWVRYLREHRNMRNDDVTLLRVDVL